MPCKTVRDFGQRAMQGRKGQGGLRLISVSKPGNQNNANGKPTDKSGITTPYVDLIHETLVRSSGEDEKTAKPIAYWPTLYDYIEDNRDADMHLQQLQYQSENWSKRSLLGRWQNLATSREGKQYKKLDINKDSKEGRFLFWSRWWASIQFMLITLVVVVLVIFGEALLWANKNRLPIEYVFIKQKWWLGYVPEPEMVDIPAGRFRMGALKSPCDQCELE